MDIFELRLRVTIRDIYFLLGCLTVFQSKERMARYSGASTKVDPDHVSYCRGLQQKVYDALKASCIERKGTAMC
jgi:hypothetical protein